MVWRTCSFVFSYTFTMHDTVHVSGTKKDVIITDGPQHSWELQSKQDSDDVSLPHEVGSKSKTIRSSDEEGAVHASTPHGFSILAREYSDLILVALNLGRR